MALAAVEDVAHQLALLEGSLGHLRLDALAQHRDDTADHLQMAEFLGGDVEQHVLPIRIVFPYSLREIPHCGRKLAVRTAELLQHEGGQSGIGFRDTHRVHQSLVVNEHRTTPQRQLHQAAEARARDRRHGFGRRRADTTRSPARTLQPTGCGVPLLRMRLTLNGPLGRRFRHAARFLIALATRVRTAQEAAGLQLDRQLSLIDLLTGTASMSIDRDRDPIDQFKAWLADAERSEPNDPNAMTLATATPDGVPSARMVLLKGVDARGFAFYTNLGSRKAHELAANPRAALCFHWKSLRRQVRVEGRIERVEDEEADAYFATRARVSQIGAWASKQSQALIGRFELEARVAKYAAKFHLARSPGRRTGRATGSFRRASNSGRTGRSGCTCDFFSGAPRTAGHRGALSVKDAEISVGDGYRVGRRATATG